MEKAQQRTFGHGRARTGSALASIVMLAALWAMPAGSYLSARLVNADNNRSQSTPTGRSTETKTVSTGLGNVRIDIIPVDLTKLPKSAFGD